MVGVWTKLVRNPQTTPLAFAPISLFDAGILWRFCNTVLVEPNVYQHLIVNTMFWCVIPCTIIRGGLWWLPNTIRFFVR